MIIKELLMGVLCVMLLTKDADASSQTQPKGLPKEIVLKHLTDFKNDRQFFYFPSKRTFEKCGWKPLDWDEETQNIWQNNGRKASMIKEISPRDLPPAAPSIFEKYSAYQTFDVIEGLNHKRYQLRICAVKFDH
ncbi:MAG: hypothetical protein C0514_03620 [Candidatus Puniceispirillum sp.]|nr:hypothetical protein [Candidatus Puniceispirillum sp.]